ncbi:endonuclease/exonuclease/phosphatase family protein [Kribbella sp. VKM Ac-2568]|uniref:endonuclease/exonuclease/phosphatase family protein n=1 Tax=Kribbella sp. VKM Ac-2568 TaxID=2512219 RepID=UPI00351A818F
MDLAVVVEIPGRGDQLFVVPTTPWRLEHEEAREKQAHDITDLDARHRTELPTIVAGDFNAGPSSPTIRYLTHTSTTRGLRRATDPATRGL